jgi:signal transduction histidine kinase
MFLEGFIKRLYKMRIGTRTAISFFAVIMIVLAFTVVALFLLQYGKNIDTKIANSYSPVISSIKNYSDIIEESGRLSNDIATESNPGKQVRLRHIVNRVYNNHKLDLINICQEPGLADIKKRIINADRKFEKVMALERKILALTDSANSYNNARIKAQLLDHKKKVEMDLNRITLELNETSLMAISVFNKLTAQKFASYRTLSYLLLVMIFAIMLLALFSVYITNVTIIQPIKELSSILDEVGEGKIINFQSDIAREDEIGEMINSAQRVVQGFKTKELVANAIGKGDYEINVPMLSRKDRLGKALTEMRNNLKAQKQQVEETINSLETTNISLEKKNKELDEFAYITSHDLKSPLRGINNLSEWIEEDIGEKLSPESKNFFKLLRGRIHRMEALINSILTYSRAGKNTEDQKIVNTLQLVNQVLENSYLTSDCVVLVDNKLPLVKANKKDLYEVFNIFISNAINHNNSKQPVVNITYKELGNMIEFCVADNGQGIAEEFHEKIFTIFQTLERRDEIENIGAGLAIGKKIIEDYGGKTWVQSELDKGAKFFFTWPV